MGQGLRRLDRNSSLVVLTLAPKIGTPLSHCGRTGGNRQIAGRDRAACSVARGIDRGCRGNVAEAKGVVESEHRFPVDGFVHQSRSASDHRRSFAVHVPGKAQARREVLAIGVVGTADAILSSLNQSSGGVGIEISQQIVLFLDHGTVLVAHSEVERQIPAGAPVILQEQAVGPVVNMQSGIANLHRCLERVAGEEIFQRG